MSIPFKNQSLKLLQVCELAHFDWYTHPFTTSFAHLYYLFEYFVEMYVKKLLIKITLDLMASVAIQWTLGGKREEKKKYQYRHLLF